MMMDGRRHSVDIPISKTLVALRRVRSLRDPSTNSMSKRDCSIDNLHCENGHGNEISLPCPDAARACDDSDDSVSFGSRNIGFNGKREQDAADSELNCGLLNSRLKPGGMSSQDDQQDDELPYSDWDKGWVSGNKSPIESCGSNHGDKGLDMASIVPHMDYVQDGNESCYIAAAKPAQLGRMDHTKSAKKLLRKNKVKPSQVVGSMAGHLSSPYISSGDAFLSHGFSPQINQDFDVLDNIDNGCGISFRWSKSPRFRESNLYYETENRPLLFNPAEDTDPNGHRCMSDNGDEISPNLETPRSLSMKFRPKSFGDLVGQDVVVRSLLGAISSGRITSLYLFHGPRGTGKTSASRIFAAALNCLCIKEQRPCGLCRECVSFFSGRSKDVKEVDSVRINRADQVKSLVKNACTPPISSPFKVFILDECQLLNRETWGSLSNNLQNLPRHVVFVMVTPELEKLPQSAVSRAQRYYFPKVKDTDIACRLEKICEEEGLDCEQGALDLIAAKSYGSVRDAEMMLDQLSLLDKKIKLSLVYELIGVVSDDELLDLLDLALSSDTSNTVLRARELMRSRIDPLQLVSQLASLIMDILAGKCENGVSEVKNSFSRYTSEADLKKLSHALRILSETEKQLRISKNQTTWFIAALLQLQSVDYPSIDVGVPKFCLRSASNGGKGSEHLATAGCKNKSYRLGVQEEHEGTLDSIWYKATGICKSSQLKTFLRKKGKLSSLHVDQSTSYLAIAELEFGHRNHVSKAEKSWKLIASSLQRILGCNVELKITYVPHTSNSKYAKLKRSSFSIFDCSGKIKQKSLLSNEQESESDNADHGSQNPMMKDKTLSSSPDCRSPVPPRKSCNGMEVVTTLRSCEGNLLSSGERFLNKYCQETMGPSCSEVDSSKEEGCNGAHLAPAVLNSVNKSICFPQTLWLQNKFRSSNSSKLSFHGI